MIFLKDALQQMEQKDERNWPVPFAITFVTADRNRRTGGEVITLPQVVLAKNVIALAQSNPAVSRELQKTNDKTRHWLNATRNLYIPESKQIRKCHIRLITHFNGLPVIY